MGGKITQLAKSAELLRVKLLREALQRGAATFSRATDPAAAEPTPDPSFASDDIEVQRAYLEQLVECTPEAISIIDHYQVLRINSEFTRMFGFQPEEALGRRIDSLIVPPDRGSETRWIGEMLAKSQKVVLETKRLHKDGSLVDVFISAAPVLVGGKRVASYVLYRDISEQKRAETLSSALYRIAEKTS